MSCRNFLNALLRAAQHELRAALFRTSAWVVGYSADAGDATTPTSTAGSLLRIDRTGQRQQECSDDEKRRRDRDYASVFTAPTHTPMPHFHYSRMGISGSSGSTGTKVNTRG
jgi:hypothetical protein